MTFNPANPWSSDPFSPPNPDVQFSLPTPIPRALPEEERLYQIQRNALKIIDDVEALGRLVDSHTMNSSQFQQLVQDAQNSYRVIKGWMARNV